MLLRFYWYTSVHSKIYLSKNQDFSVELLSLFICILNNGTVFHHSIIFKLLNYYNLHSVNYLLYTPYTHYVFISDDFYNYTELYDDL